MAGNSPETQTSWIIDSGSMDHIIHEGNLLEQGTNTDGNSPVKTLNGDRASITAIGKARLPNGLNIDHVLHVPSFNCNLLSVSQLTKEHNCALIFFADGCVVQDLEETDWSG